MFSRVQLFVTPWTAACQAPRPWNFPARILEWVAIFYSRGSSLPRDWTHVFWVSCMGRQIFYYCATWEAQYYNYVPFNVLPKNSVKYIMEEFLVIWICLDSNFCFFLKLVSSLAKFSLNRPTIKPSLKKRKKKISSRYIKEC